MENSNRRRFLKQVGLVGLATAFLDTPGLFAEALAVTPEQTEGPYYPTTLPLDTDNDLLVINDNINPAIGQITYLSGRILSPSGEPVRNATMEIWQADNSGAYIHPASVGYANRDRNFQGFGRFLTGSTGEYLFRTIKPGLYPGRTRHIHFKVKVAGMATLTSQVYVLGEPQNANDGILMGIRDTKARNSVVVPFAPIEGSTVGAVAARLDVVLSGTPAQVPVLEMTNTSDPARNPDFKVGDSWRADIRNATPGARVYLHLWKDNVDLGISGPYGDVTNASGIWTMSGSYGASEAGSWQAQAVIGSSASQETSAPVTMQIYNT
jgi:protocatechuate 3,4-dioxygenase, beta subunit